MFGETLKQMLELWCWNYFFNKSTVVYFLGTNLEGFSMLNLRTVTTLRGLNVDDTCF